MRATDGLTLLLSYLVLWFVGAGLPCAVEMAGIVDVTVLWLCSSRCVLLLLFSRCGYAFSIQSRPKIPLVAPRFASDRWAIFAWKFVHKTTQKNHWHIRPLITNVIHIFCNESQCSTYGIAWFRYTKFASHVRTVWCLTWEERNQSILDISCIKWHNQSISRRYKALMRQSVL